MANISKQCAKQAQAEFNAILRYSRKDIKEAIISILKDSIYNEYINIYEELKKFSIPLHVINDFKLRVAHPYSKHLWCYEKCAGYFDLRYLTQFSALEYYLSNTSKQRKQMLFDYFTGKINLIYPL